MVWGNLVTWRSKKKLVVAHSSAEAKFRAIAQGMCEVIWLERLLEDLKIPLIQPTRVYSDSKSTISIMKNPIQHDRMKHVRIDRSFIKREIEGGLILSYIPTTDRVVDVLTKAMVGPGFEFLIGKLGITCIYSSA